MKEMNYEESIKRNSHKERHERSRNKQRKKHDQWENMCGSLKGERGMAAFTLENFTRLEQIQGNRCFS